MVDLEANREYYQHGPLCDGKTFTELNERGVKTCIDCAGIFDKDGKGIAVTSKRLDANWTPPPEETNDG